MWGISSVPLRGLCRRVFHVPTLCCQSASECTAPYFTSQYGTPSVADGTDQHCQEWKTTHFQRVTLKDLGLRVQLGHSFGQYCPFRETGNKDFVVIGMNGIHQVNVDFCGCPGHPELYIQLLEMRWWPLTPIAP
jgi:hypothetical protein